MALSGALLSLRAGETTAPAAPRPAAGPAAGGRYRIEQYEVTGSNLLSPDEIQALLRKATGPAVTVPQIQEALQNLQRAYRDRGLARAAVTLPSQSLTNGRVRLRVDQPQSTPTAPRDPVSLPGWTVPRYEVRHFVVQGNTALAPEDLDRILGSVAGPSVSPEALARALRDLRSAYRDKGYAGSSLVIPAQVLTDGTVAVRVEEGTRVIPPPAVAVAPTNTPPPPAFTVERYEVSGNTLLKPEVVDALLAPATGTHVTLPRLQKALGDLQLAYRERGYATVSVGLPPQQLTNATVKVQVTEGVLVDVQVTGNRHFSSNNIVRALPSLRTNAPLNSRVFQRELDLANQNRDRQIYPVLGPGPDPGTSALTLRVKDRFPIHGRLEVNNLATPGTPEWRVNTSAQYNNLWQREHQLGLSYGFSPEQMKDPLPEPDLFLNRPLIAFAGAYYKLPFGSPESVEQQIRSNQGFGFNEATRQYRLPPPGARDEFTLFASAASTDTGVQYGAERVVSQTPLLTIISQDTGRNLSTTETVGGRYSRPWSLGETRRLNLSGGLDFRHFQLESFNTNNFRITTVVTNAEGSQVIESVVSSPQPSRQNEVGYLPLGTSLDYFHTDARGSSSSASLGVSYNFVGSQDDFQAIAYSREASASFGKATVALGREQRLPHDFNLNLRANGQMATGPLISNEQFILGGINSLRGYFEGDEVGDAGWAASLELRTPQWATRVPIGPSQPVPAWLRAMIFTDVGQRFLLDETSATSPVRTLWSAGFGVSANVNNHVDLRVVVGWPLQESANRPVGEPRANLSVGGQF